MRFASDSRRTLRAPRWRPGRTGAVRGPLDTFEGLGSPYWYHIDKHNGLVKCHSTILLFASRGLDPRAPIRSRAGILALLPSCEENEDGMEFE